MTGGSDSHVIKSIGSVVTCTKKNNTKNIVSPILDKISSNNAIVVGTEVNIISEIIKSSFALIKKIILR